MESFTVDKVSILGALALLVSAFHPRQFKYALRRSGFRSGRDFGSSTGPSLVL